MVRSILHWIINFCIIFFFYQQAFYDVYYIIKTKPVEFWALDLKKNKFQYLR